jgi:hypothetical protein
MAISISWTIWITDSIIFCVNPCLCISCMYADKFVWQFALDRTTQCLDLFNLNRWSTRIMYSHPSLTPLVFSCCCCCCYILTSLSFVAFMGSFPFSVSVTILLFISSLAALFFSFSSAIFLFVTFSLFHSVYKK